MKNRKTSTFIFEGFGFPVKLINVPMKKVLGEWCIDVNMNKLMLVVLETLAHKETALTHDELRFIRSYLKLSMADFGKLFGVSHVAVLKWEKGKNKISPSLELCLRLYILEYLKAKDRDFRALFREVDLNKLSKTPKGKIHPLVVDISTDELKIAL
jgi:DNA-binding transcriptional regulator YiaG